MSLTELAKIQCPYCWEEIDIMVDCSAGNQQYIEDCQVCCEPISLVITCNDNALPSVDAQKENN